MILKNAPSIEQLLEQIEGKTVVAFPGGNAFLSMLRNEEKSDLFSKISFIVDNDRAKDGSIKRTCFGELRIRHIEALRDVSPDDLAVLVAHEQFIDMVAQLDDMDELNDAECYVYPIFHALERGRSEVSYGNKQQIPKVLHYIWFGGHDIDDVSKRCMETWYRVCPDYDIVRWDESNYDVYATEFTKANYKMGMYAFVSDYARQDIIYRHGGIYLDTDVELIKSYDPLLTHQAFSSFSCIDLVEAGLAYGSVPQNPLVKEVRDFFNYQDYTVIAAGGTGLHPLTSVLRAHGLKQNGRFQIVDGMAIFPKEYFGAVEYLGFDTRTDNTYCIHYPNGSWLKNSSTDNYRDVLKRKRPHIQKIVERMGIHASYRNY